MKALLKRVDPHQDARMMLSQAVRAFVRREDGKAPTWVDIGEHVVLPAGSTGPLGLTRLTTGQCRPGHILVGSGDHDPPDKKDGRAALGSAAFSPDSMSARPPIF